MSAERALQGASVLHLVYCAVMSRSITDAQCLALKTFPLDC